MDLIKYPTITISRGATKIINFDLQFAELHGGYMVLTIKDMKGNLMRTVEMRLQGVNKVILPDEFTATLVDKKYKYDLMLHIADERFAQCLPSDIEVIDSVGGYTIV